MLVISCHADTGYERHALWRLPDGRLYGRLDNYTGVYAVMQAFFSGRMTQDYLRVELTYGEETDFAGALAVRETLRPHDLVLVVDVTGTPTTKDFVIEKCADPALQGFLREAFDGLAFDLYADCPDPVADVDETDVYRDAVRHCCFLGVPCSGGDYNAGDTWTHEAHLRALAEALCRVAEQFPQWCAQVGVEAH